MAGTHFSGPVYSKGGFVGMTDSTGAVSQTVTDLTPAPISISTAGNVTLTAAQVLTGMILRDANAGNRTDTLPTAALLVAALGGNAATSTGGTAYVGTTIQLLMINTTGTANTFQLAMGTGGTAVGTTTTGTVAQGASRWYTIRLTNVTSGAEAYSVYS
jgi:hypothetical protein